MLTPSELAVLSYLVRCSDDTGICYPSIHTIATACAMSDNTVRKCVRKLEDRDYLKVRRLSCEQIRQGAEHFFYI